MFLFLLVSAPRALSGGEVEAALGGPGAPREKEKERY